MASRSTSGALLAFGDREWLLKGERRRALPRNPSAPSTPGPWGVARPAIPPPAAGPESLTGRNWIIQRQVDRQNRRPRRQNRKLALAMISSTSRRMPPSGAAGRPHRAGSIPPPACSAIRPGAAHPARAGSRAGHQRSQLERPVESGVGQRFRCLRIHPPLRDGSEITAAVVASLVAPTAPTAPSQRAVSPSARPPRAEPPATATTSEPCDRPLGSHGRPEAANRARQLPRQLRPRLTRRCRDGGYTPAPPQHLPVPRHDRLDQDLRRRRPSAPAAWAA